MQRILITGVAGFIGSNLCKRLLKENYYVIGVDNFDGFYSREIKEQNISVFSNNKNFKFHELDICDNLDALYFEKFDIVVHLAGKAGVHFSIKDVESYLQTNILGTKNILELMKNVGCDKIIFSSSSSLYGNLIKNEFSENDSTDYPLTPYATSKKASELLLYNYHNIYNTNSVILRFFSVYGENQRPDLVFSKFSDKIRLNNIIEVYGYGESMRDYTDVSDIIEGIILSMFFLNRNSNVYEIFNIGNAHPICIKDVVNCLYKYYNKETCVKYIDNQEGDMNYTCADIGKAERILGYSPKIDFAEGIRNFCEWYDKTNKDE